METRIPQAKRIDQIMTRHPVTIGYEESIQKGSDLMLQHRFRHLPVTDSMGEGHLSNPQNKRLHELAAPYDQR
jgi:CBS domain-containing protein